MKKAIIFLLALTANTTVLATGIPLIDPTAPIKVSESSIYSCGSDGKAYALDDDDGELRPLAFSGVAVTCHDDQLWFEKRPVSFNDLLLLTMKEFELIHDRNKKG